MSKDAQSSERKARDVGVFVPDAQCKLHFFHAGWAKEGSERIELSDTSTRETDLAA